MDIAPIFKDDFTREYDRLVSWFHPKMTKEMADLAYNKVKYLPFEALRFAVDYFVENSRPTPGSFPTLNELVNKIYEWLDSHPEEKFKRMEFDPHNDFTYPLSKLWDGYRILRDRGYDSFKLFADRNRMPTEDRERVVMKYKVTQSDKEMPDLTQKVGREL